ncbi:5'/3'-nucleotidase SurE [Roseimicrobium sp. ORNL1]|uniref:5'/3'-nucleotidase SurE n=1 Tax=Roseimicrobium sp. ORNL1 TaxID=2711231 RepID=UPI0013E18982|nr:5'/3'-nucleotidase SurE [Roseimicrobium sp. ORNL1]QIF01368.1 5'/3'-nucleotidase SurE [Roseimicrobium sp. ORNL1]
MHFLITNDDGIHAPGLSAMAEAVSLIPGATFSVVAPSSERSQCGHSLTTHQLLTTVQESENRYHTSGTPADCVRLGLFALGIEPDFVLSGVNAGGNMGQDIPISGTLAGAREAAYHGIPAIAVSHYLISGIALDWSRVARWTAQLLQELVTHPLSNGELWNVNLPHLPPGERELPERIATTPCRLPLNVAYEDVITADTPPGHRTLKYTARYADRPVEPGSDVEACFGGKISVSRLRL